MESLPQTAQELGIALRKLRGDRGLRKLESSQNEKDLVLSKSTLARYESGQRPPLQYAEHLSHIYGGDGWVELAVRRLWMSDWDPWSTDNPATTYSIAWPAQYAGPVWIYIRPTPHHVDESHRIILQWGPWQCEQNIVLSRKGATLTTGKHQDDSSPITCTVTANYSIHLLHGAGEGSKQRTIDIRSLWYPSY